MYSLDPSIIIPSRAAVAIKAPARAPVLGGWGVGGGVTSGILKFGVLGWYVEL